MISYTYNVNKFRNVTKYTYLILNHLTSTQIFREIDNINNDTINPIFFYFLILSEIHLNSHYHLFSFIYLIS